MTIEQELEQRLKKFEKKCKIREEFDRENALAKTKEYAKYHGRELCKNIGRVQSTYQLECIDSTILVLKEILEALESRKEQLL